MNSIRATERQMRKLQKQRHLYEIQNMILSNPLFKNLNSREQKQLLRLIYKAEMMEMFMRDRSIVRINDSFEQIVEDVANMLQESMRDEEDDDEDNRRDDY